LVPVHEPDAVQLVVLVVLQVSVELAPLATLNGDAVNVSVGAPGAVIVIAAVRDTDPPAPVHVSV
jgi:hypothetical protein